MRPGDYVHQTVSLHDIQLVTNGDGSSRLGCLHYSFSSISGALLIDTSDLRACSDQTPVVPVQSGNTSGS
jgi:hypothetical protein